MKANFSIGILALPLFFYWWGAAQQPLPFLQLLHHLRQCRLPSRRGRSHQPFPHPLLLPSRPPSRLHPTHTWSGQTAAHATLKSTNAGLRGYMRRTRLLC